MFQNCIHFTITEQASEVLFSRSGTYINQQKANCAEKEHTY